MAEGKLNLPDDLLPFKPSDRHWTSKVEASGRNEEKIDELKDQLLSESSVPLSPQWLYAKPTETKMDARIPSSVSNDPSQKDRWRLDGSEEKKDWRRIVIETESNHHWREEERETGLLSGRRDRRKGDRRVDTASMRETNESGSLSSLDRWTDANIRNPGLESRRDSKWLSRWGREDKEKESRSEKRTDAEKEKEDTANDNKLFVSSNRSIPERDTDSRDKWRPRHRMEVHSSGSTASRAAPGFGPDKGRVEGLYTGFTIGRGRTAGIGKLSSSSIGAIHSLRSENIPGKPNFSAYTFCYPRGKLLDIYRRQKLDPSFDAMPAAMEESPYLTQVGMNEPLAFIAPETEEEAILCDIWKGKVTSSVVYNSCKQERSNENVSEFSEEEQGLVTRILTGATVDNLQEAASTDAYQVFAVSGKEITSEEEDKVASNVLASNSDGLVLAVPKTNGSCSAMDIGSTQSVISENMQTGFVSSGRPQFDGNESTSPFNLKMKLPDGSSSMFIATFEQNKTSDLQSVESNIEGKKLGERTSPNEFMLFYIDPQGNTQGPFLGADIIMWFKEGFFGLDLPVRLADSPEGTPFQELGKVIPQLKDNDGDSSIIDLNSELEEYGALGGNVKVNLPASGSVINIPHSSIASELHHLVSEFNNLSSEHVQPRIPEDQLQLPHSQDLKFENFIAQDEEIVFPGTAGSSSYPGHVFDPFVTSSNHLALSNELTATGVSNQMDNKLHRFGLLWSELDGAQSRNNLSLDTAAGMGMTAASFGAVADPAVAEEPWTDIYRKSIHPHCNLYQDAIASHRMSHVEQESNNFDLAERIMSHQVQKQHFQQLNKLSPHAHLNESVLEHFSNQNQNLVHQQQLPKQSTPDMEHLLALEVQHQQQLQRQQYQLQRQLQFHQQQKLLQEKQLSQVRQVFLEQLLCGQVPDSGLGQSHFDPIRSKNALNQVLYEQQLIHELQQSHVPSIEQLVQAKFGQMPSEEHQRDLLISRSHHGKLPSLEHQHLRQEQLQRQLSRQHAERDVDSIWPSGHTNQLLRNHAGISRAHSSSFSPLDFIQQQQRPIHDEQLSHLEHNLSLREQFHQGHFEPSSLQFERSMSLPAGASGLNMDAVIGMAHAKGLDIQEPSALRQSNGLAVTFPSGIHPHDHHQSLVPSQVHVSQVDSNEGRWSDSNGKLENDWMESQIQQLQINSRQLRRDSEVKMASESPDLWISDGLNEDKSRQLLMELLHKKSSRQPESVDKTQSGFYTGSSSLDHPFKAQAEQDVGLNKSFMIGSYASSSSEPSHSSLADRQAGHLESNERLLFRDESGAVSEAQPFVAHICENSQAIYRGDNMTGLLTASKESSDKEWRNYGSKSDTVTMISRFEDQNGMPELGEGTCNDQGEIPVTKAQEGLSGFISEPAGRGKNKSSSNNGGKRDFVGIMTNHVDIAASAKKDTRFQRTSSYSEADISEASFIDMLKGNNSKKNATADVHVMTAGTESSDGSQGVKGGKKKGKKGRQIDPALLGFKVTSNRIMMGEIQRLND